MNFFTPVTKPSKGTQETVKKVHIPWHKGTKPSKGTHEIVNGLKGQNSYYTYVTPAGTFVKRQDALLANNCTHYQLKSRCKRASFPGWTRELKPAFADSMSVFYGIMSGRVGKSNYNAKPVMTYYGQYPSVEAVAKAAGVTGNVVRRWIKKYPKHYYYIGV